jgi:hypothetical protein
VSTVSGEQDRKLLSRLHASRSPGSERRVGADAKQARRGKPEDQATCESLGAENRVRRTNPGAMP